MANLYLWEIDWGGRSMDKYYLGCPIWGNKAWVNNFFSSDAKPGKFLAQYASAFNTVEGNTTFYGLPGKETIAKWHDATPFHFQFAFKFPRTISHDKSLTNTEADVDRFLELMAPLESRLGPFFLQLPPGFVDFPALERFLIKLPPDFQYAVEARNPGFYDEFIWDFDQLLTDLNMDRVIFDTRRLMSYETQDVEIRESKRKKPKTPVLPGATGPRPFLRYVGRPNPEEDVAALKEWAHHVAGWINEGRTPYVFMHQAPDDDLAPQLCQLFHHLLQEILPELEPLPPWPFDLEEKPGEQLELF